MLSRWRRRAVALSLVVTALTAGAGPAAADAAPVAFTNQLLTSFTGADVSHDFEPAIRIGPDGSTYVAANYHNTATAVRGVELWTAAAGGALTSVGLIPPTLGGLDVDLAVGSTGTLYDATLYSQTPNAPTGSYGVGTGSCPAGSLPADVAACTGVQKVDISHTDRPWLAADGPSTVYLSYHDGAQSEQIDVAKSTDGGHTWGKPAEAIAPSLRNQANFYNFAGNLVVDPADHTVYQVFVAGPTPGKGQNQDYNTMYMAVSRDGGQTFTDHLVYQAPAGARLDNLWPAAAVDAGGTVYAGWSDGGAVWIAASTDHGVTWAAPIQVSVDPDLQSNVEPWLAAGRAGDVGVAWYGSPAADNMDPTATWQVYYAQVRGAASAAPTISETVVSDHTILTGALCTEGDACPAGTRVLYDDLGVALDPMSGLATVAYGDASDPANHYQIAIGRQTAGPGL